MSNKTERYRIIGKKLGMTHVFDEQGNMTPCTVIELQPNQVVQVKTEERDGYNAIQLASDKIKVKRPETLEKRVTKPRLGHFAKASVEPHRKLMETRVKSVEGIEVGSSMGLELLEGVAKVDVTTEKTIGKGYQGVMKRFGFSGGPASHGSGFHRHAGSTGMRSTPGRNFPGSKKAGQMGGKRSTVQSLKVVEISKEDHLLLVKGAVPGPVGGAVMVAPALKS